MKSPPYQLTLLLTLVPGVLSAVPAGWPPAYPEWWYDADPSKSVVDVDRTLAGDHGNSSPLLLGQLKHMATIARDELDEQLALIGGAGPAIDNFVDGFVLESGANRSPANLGQLKNSSHVFFDRFADIGFGPGEAGWPDNLSLSEGANDHSPRYPWLNDSTPDNTSIANLGQVKHLFSWSISQWVSVDENPADGILDWRITFAQTLDPNGDYDGDNATNQLELEQGTDPIDPLSIPITYPDLSQMTYTYDQSGRLLGIAYGNGYNVEYSYDDEGSLQSSYVDYIEE
ncbi:MAG: hypothetical protein Q7P63_01405 [Verrucomicrobiota bacterium JB022]|nr:hypothetical protein [Verrucomicrobiota bacterium JB022]